MWLGVFDSVVENYYGDGTMAQISSKWRLPRAIWVLRQHLSNFGLQKCTSPLCVVNRLPCFYRRILGSYQLERTIIEGYYGLHACGSRVRWCSIRSVRCIMPEEQWWAQALNKPHRPQIWPIWPRKSMPKCMVKCMVKKPKNFFCRNHFRAENYYRFRSCYNISDPIEKTQPLCPRRNMSLEFL